MRKTCHTSRSAIINDAVGICVDNPETFGRIINALITRGNTTAPSSRKTNTSVLVNVSYLDRLDQMAHRLRMSRNTLVNIIMGGINLRVI